MSRLTRDGIAEPVSRDRILRRERGQGSIHFPCSADHVQDWQTYLVDQCFLAICVTIHAYICIMCYFTGQTGINRMERLPIQLVIVS